MKIMKKFKIILLLSVMMFTFTLASCNNNANDPKKPDNPKITDDEKPEPDVPPEQSMISKEAMAKIHKIYGSASTAPQTVTTVRQLAILTSICAARESNGPISVTPATLNGEEITLITLGGTEEKDGQATTTRESMLASRGQSNDYLTAVEKLIKDHTIPQNKPVLITGISLGGMIAQQLVGKQRLFDNNGITVKGIICFGSPFTKPLKRGDSHIIRFTDENDVVPRLGESIYKMSSSAEQSAISLLNEKERIVRRGKYTGIEAHALSYISEDCWNDVDFMGSAKKDNVLVLTKEMTFYPAPKLT